MHYLGTFALFYIVAHFFSLVKCYSVISGEKFKKGKAASIMKKAINAWCVAPTYTMEETFAKVSAAGFEGIELNVDSEGKSPHSLGMKTTEADYANIRELSKKYNLPVCSIASALWAPKMADASRHAEAQALLNKQLEAAVALGVKSILVVPSYGGNNLLSEARANIVAFLKAHLPEIEKSGVTVCLENVPSGFFCSPYDWTALIDELGSDKIAMYFDVGNMMYFSRPEDWIDVLGKRIRMVHIKDVKRNSDWICSSGDEVGLLKGDINWEAVMPMLREIGYDGWLVGESFKDEDAQSYEEYFASLSAAFDTIMKI